MSFEKIILVDPDDNQIGEIEKHLGHRYGMLHRAFSVIVFRTVNGRLETLLQQRHKDKYHGGELWTNTCCSHPHIGESVSHAAHVRLKSEMGLDIPLQEVGKFHYVALFDNGMVENEIDHVFIGTYNDQAVAYDKSEVQDYCWVEVKELQEQIHAEPKKYSPWLRQALDIAIAGYQQ